METKILNYGKIILELPMKNGTKSLVLDMERIMPSLYLLPIFTAINGLFVAIALGFGVMRVIKKMIKSLEIKIADRIQEAGEVGSLVELLELDRDLRELVEKHLDDLIQALRNQIPMASMFFSSTMAEKMKGQARDEIMKMAPELKKKLISKLQNKANINSWIAKKIHDIASRLGEPYKVKRVILVLSAFGFLFGLLFGAMQALIIYFWSRHGAS